MVRQGRVRHRLREALADQAAVQQVQPDRQVQQVQQVQRVQQAQQAQRV